MNDITINCPHCKKLVKVTELLAAPLVEQSVGKRLAEEQARLSREADAKAQGNVDALEEQLSKAKAELAGALKKERELSAREKDLDLEVEKRIRLEVEKVQARLSETKDNEYQRVISERNHLIVSLRDQAASLQRKLEQGSQQVQGEILELNLETLLKEEFSRDNITPVPKGIHGGDVVQAVFDDQGNPAGCVLWECKNTKTWSDGWVAKLKQDKTEAKAVLAVLVTVALPKNTKGFSVVNGVWVVPVGSAIGAAQAARQWLINMARVEKAFGGANTKAEEMYAYLIGPVFRNKLEQVMGLHAAMRDGLEKERRALQKQWSIREEQINSSLSAVVGISGDVQGISGKLIGDGDPLAELGAE